MPLKKRLLLSFPLFHSRFFLFAQQLAFNLWEPLLHFLEFLFCCCGVFDWFSCLEKWWDAPCPQKAIHVHAPIYMMLPHPIESDREAFILSGEQKCLLEPWLGPTTCSFHPQLFASPPFFGKAIWQALRQRWISQDFCWKKNWFDTYQGNDKKGLHTMKKPVAMVFETSNTKPWIATWINIMDAYSIINTCQILKKTIQKTSDIPPHFWHTLHHPSHIFNPSPTLASALWRCVLATSTRRCASVAKRKAWKRLGCNWVGCISLSPWNHPLGLAAKLRLKGYIFIY